MNLFFYNSSCSNVALLIIGFFPKVVNDCSPVACMGEFEISGFWIYLDHNTDMVNVA